MPGRFAKVRGDCRRGVNSCEPSAPRMDLAVRAWEMTNLQVIRYLVAALALVALSLSTLGAANPAKQIKLVSAQIANRIS